MKCIVHKFSDGTVEISHISPTCLAALTGNGGLIREEQVAQQIAKMSSPPAPEVGLPLDIATNWVNAIHKGGLTETAAIALLAAKDNPPDCVECYVKEESTLPVDRNFRAAWEAPTGTVKVNMPKARNIHMDRIRVARNTALAVLDIPFMKAVEAGDTAAQAAVTAQKQTLRDIPQDFSLDAFDTPENLKAAVPPELAGKM